MKVTRRQGLLAIVATVGGAVLEASLPGRLRLILKARASRQDEADRAARRRPSRKVEPDPRSVKRHA